MVNVILLIVLLDNRLCDDLFSRNIDCLFSEYIVDLSRFSDSLKLNLFIICLRNP